MRSPIRSTFIFAIGTASLMSSVAFAQIVEPKSGPAATTVTATTTNVTITKWMTEQAVGQWRASKMIGLNIYNDDNEKIGDIAELIVDGTGKLEAIVVGAGGFLGIGERDVAVPYDQIKWVFTPVPSPNASTGPTTSGTAITSGERHSYPDHAVLSMTKDQLKAAPAYKFSR
jgi:sporulation protein YlmC with PRC-barrel domain